MTELKDASRIARNSMFLSVSTIINNIIGLILAVCIGRYLGKELFGSYIFAFSFVLLFATFTDWGFPELTTRELARDKSKASKYLGNLILLKSCFAFLTFGLILLAINLIDSSSSVKLAVGIVAVYMIAEYFGRFFDAVFNAFERMQFTAALTFLLKILILAGVLTAIRSGWALKEILLVYAASGAIYVAVGLWLISTKFAHPKYELDLTFCRNILKTAFPFALLYFFSIISEKIDITILKMISGSSAVGLYGAANRMIMAVVFIPVNLSVALYPAFSRFYQSARDALVKYYRKAFQFLLVLAFPLAVGTVILAERFILLFWGPKYIEATVALQILICRTVLVFLIPLLRIMLLACDRQKFFTVVVFGAIVLNVGLNLILIPRLSYIGASIAALLTTIATSCTYFLYISKHVCRIDLAKIIGKPLLAALLMGLLVWFIQDLNLILVVVLAAACYLAVILLLRTFAQEDLDLAKRLFRGMFQRA